MATHVKYFEEYNNLATSLLDSLKPHNKEVNSKSQEVIKSYLDYFNAVIKWEADKIVRKAELDGVKSFLQLKDEIERDIEQKSSALKILYDQSTLNRAF